jgi:integrase
MRINDVAKAPPGRHRAGPSLYLIVSADGQARRWVFRFTKPSTRRVTELGLGSAHVVTLAEARDRAHDYRRAVVRGEDPIEQKREQRRTQITFEELASAYIAVKQPGWRSENHWRNLRLLLNTYASPLATKIVSSITADDVEAAVRSVWQRSPQQGRRTISAIRQVFDYAMALGHCPTNPADWRRMKHRFAKTPPGNHFAALDYVKVPGFVKQLHVVQQRNTALSPYVIEFLILTACRSSEVVGMRWSEVDFDAKLWTIPASRTKAAREHRVPLSDRAMALLIQRRKVSDGEHVWPIGIKAIYLLTKNIAVGVTVHGFRSSFRDWAGNETNFDRVTCELALGHRAGDATELAYRRSDALVKRRTLMDAWAEWCNSVT